MRNPKQHLHCVKQCIQSLNTLSADNNVTVNWIPGHSGHEGNEVADKLAHLAASEILGDGQKHGDRITKSTIKMIISKWLIKKLQQRFRNDTGARQTKMLFKKCSNNISKSILHLPKETIHDVIGVLTGHNLLNNHLSVMEIREDPECDFCGVPETAQHYLLECEKFYAARMSCSIQADWTCKSGKALTQLCKYIKKTKRFA